MNSFQRGGGGVVKNQRKIDESLLFYKSRSRQETPGAEKKKSGSAALNTVNISGQRGRPVSKANLFKNHFSILGKGSLHNLLELDSVEGTAGELTLQEGVGLSSLCCSYNYYSYYYILYYYYSFYTIIKQFQLFLTKVKHF